MLRGEGFKGNENQTAWESRGNACTAFLNFLQASSVSIKQMFDLHLDSGKKTRIGGLFGDANSVGFIYRPFLLMGTDSIYSTAFLG